QVGRASLHFVSHDRIEERDSARAAAAYRRSDLRLRRLSRRVPVESLRQSFAGNGIRFTKIDKKLRASRLSGAERNGIPGFVSRFADQTDQAARIFAERVRRAWKCRHERGSAGLATRGGRFRTVDRRTRGLGDRANSYARQGGRVNS